MKQSRKPDSEITAILSAFHRSRKTMRQYCKERDINYWTFRNWINRGKKRSVTKHPLPVISFSPQPGAVDDRYEIRFADMTTIRIPMTIPVDQIIAALRGRR